MIKSAAILSAGIVLLLALSGCTASTASPTLGKIPGCSGIWTGAGPRSTATPPPRAAAPWATEPASTSTCGPHGTPRRGGLHLPDGRGHDGRLHPPVRQRPRFGERLHHGRYLRVAVVHHHRHHGLRTQLCRQPGISYRERAPRAARDPRPGVLVQHRLLPSCPCTRSEYSVTQLLSVIVTQPLSVTQRPAAAARADTTGFGADLGLRRVVHGHCERVQRPLQLEQRVRALQPAMDTAGARPSATT